MQHLTIATSSGIVWLMLVSHFGAALVALLAGTIALSVVKGGRLHKRIAGPGAQVLVHYGSGAKEAAAVVAEISEAGGRADAVAADLSAPDGAHKLARQVRAVVGDRLDILVAKAGISKAATTEETTVEDFD